MKDCQKDVKEIFIYGIPGFFPGDRENNRYTVVSFRNTSITFLTSLLRDKTMRDSSP